MKTLLGAVLIAVAVGYLEGCTFQLDSERYLSKEQDEKMRELCEPHGCRVIPLPAWREIEKRMNPYGPTKV